MAWDGKIIEIFLSSPSDVQVERDTVKSIIQEWNQRRGRDSSCMFSLLTWEDSVTSELENDGQDSINSQIGDTYDVILGLMWGRFGSPTAREDSGTLEEFRRALNRKREGDPVRISFYFKTSDIPFEKMDPDQIKKVKEFKSLFQKEGGLTRDFTDGEELRSQINLLLEHIAKNKDSYPTDNSPKSPSEPKAKKGKLGENQAQPEAQSAQVDGASANTSDWGLIDITERMQELTDEFSAESEQWASQTNSLGDAAVKGSEELESLSRFGQPSSADIRKSIEKVATAFDKNAEYCEKHSPKIVGLMQEITQLNEERVSIMEDFSYSHEDKEEYLKSLIELSETIHDTTKSTQGLLDSIDQMPRMTKRFNESRRRVIFAHAPFMDELHRSAIVVDRTIAALKRLS
ncbi:hypothetical protein EEB18_011570 [Sphingopyxis sp. OPL5]|uniref:hypothetical protein n=1 Tax=Sphingopyxis sp. OPL5 TaxID=2486273 RepID=UPI00164D331F|nr:hypothetical protein [Sphingopyxis sp. OPL5]QNO25448.1 hypothetical protein EEB18_011570 [Sphingopyxis sp. OPL5]